MIITAPGRMYAYRLQPISIFGEQPFRQVPVLPRQVHYNAFFIRCKYSCLPKNHLLSDLEIVKSRQENAHLRVLVGSIGIVLLNCGKKVLHYNFIKNEEFFFNIALPLFYFGGSYIIGRSRAEKLLVKLRELLF